MTGRADKKQKGSDGFVIVLLTIALAAELCVLVISVLLGELREFLSIELQAFTLIAALAITLYLRMIEPDPVEEAPAQAHARGCRQCGAEDAVEYATEYGWYETYVHDSGNMKETKRSYLPLGVVNVRVCDACAARENARRVSRSNQINRALACVGLPILIGAGYLLGWFASIGLTPPALDADGRGFSWLAVGAAGIALLSPALQALGIALDAPINLVTPQSRRQKMRQRRLRAFAQTWSWELVSRSIGEEWEEGTDVAFEGGGRVIKGIGPKTKETESWEQRPATSLPRRRQR